MLDKSDINKLQEAINTSPQKVLETIQDLAPKCELYKVGYYQASPHRPITGDN